MIDTTEPCEPAIRAIIQAPPSTTCTWTWRPCTQLPTLLTLTILPPLSLDHSHRALSLHYPSIHWLRLLQIPTAVRIFRIHFPVLVTPSAAVCDARRRRGPLPFLLACYSSSSLSPPRRSDLTWSTRTTTQPSSLTTDRRRMLASALHCQPPRRRD